MNILKELSETCEMIVTVSGSTISDKEREHYIKHCEEKHKGKRIRHIDINVDGDYVDIGCEFDTVPFERIRRITGYLVGTLDRFNDGKRAEVRDRVKHTLSE